MNKLLALLLICLFVSQTFAFSFRLSDGSEDNGEDNGEFSGEWSELFYIDNGEVVDQGEVNGNYFFYDNGEINITAFYARQYSIRQDKGEDFYDQDSIQDAGEFSHVGPVDGHISKQEVSNLVLKRLRNYKN